MKRTTIEVRPDWQSKVESLGFTYHTLDGVPYWDESVCYTLNYEQVAILEESTRELYSLCLQAVDHIIRNDLLELFFIPPAFHQFVKDSWRHKKPSIYGRFDLSWSGRTDVPPKLLEFNADTPTSLFEASVVQWFWLQDICPEGDQFNSIHEKLISRWKRVKKGLQDQPYHFSCLSEFPEDHANVSYIQDCATQGGIYTRFINVHDIGHEGNRFLDLENNPIEHIFKLYPWEWLMHEEYGPAMLSATTTWIEPPWKMLLSNKAILPVLWKLFPGHPNLLECHFDHPRLMRSYAVKPLLSREGANVTLIENDNLLQETQGEYGEEGFIYQQLHKLPSFDGNFPVVGSWIIGGQPAGIGFRETRSLVTDNFSRFVPHMIERHSSTAR